MARKKKKERTVERVKDRDAMISRLPGRQTRTVRGMTDEAPKIGSGHSSSRRLRVTNTVPPPEDDDDGKK